MENFSEILKRNELVLVDFFATWCSPCKRMHPTIEELEKELGAKMRVLKVDIDNNEALVTLYRIQSVPTLILFKQGEIKWRRSGVMDKVSLLNEIYSYLE